MDQFQSEVIINFYNDGSGRKTLEDFIKLQIPINGAAVITKVTTKLKDYLGDDGKDLIVGGFALGFCPSDKIQVIVNDTTSKYYKTLKLYKSLTDEDRKTFYLVSLELPDDEDPMNCDRRLLFSNGLNCAQTI